MYFFCVWKLLQIASKPNKLPQRLLRSLSNIFIIMWFPCFRTSFIYKLKNLLHLFFWNCVEFDQRTFYFTNSVPTLNRYDIEYTKTESTQYFCLWIFWMWLEWKCERKVRQEVISLKTPLIATRLSVVMIQWIPFICSRQLLFGSLFPHRQIVVLLRLPNKLTTIL